MGVQKSPQSSPVQVRGTTRDPHHSNPGSLANGNGHITGLFRHSENRFPRRALRWRILVPIAIACGVVVVSYATGFTKPRLVGTPIAIDQQTASPSSAEFMFQVENMGQFGAEIHSVGLYAAGLGSPSTSYEIASSTPYEIKSRPSHLPITLPPHESLIVRSHYSRFRCERISKLGPSTVSVMASGPLGLTMTDGVSSVPDPAQSWPYQLTQHICGSR